MKNYIKGICVISNYDSQFMFSTNLEGKEDSKFTKLARGEANVNYMFPDINFRMYVYKKYNIDTIIYCENGDINIYTKLTDQKEIPEEDYHVDTLLAEL